MIWLQTRRLNKHLRTGTFPGRSALTRYPGKITRSSDEEFCRESNKRWKNWTRKCWCVHRFQGLLLHMDRIFIVKINPSRLNIWRSMQIMVFINHLYVVHDSWTWIKIFGLFQILKTKNQHNFRSELATFHVNFITFWKVLKLFFCEELYIAYQQVGLKKRALYIWNIMVIFLHYHGAFWNLALFYTYFTQDFSLSFQPNSRILVPSTGEGKERTVRRIGPVNWTNAISLTRLFQ